MNPTLGLICAGLIHGTFPVSINVTRLPYSNWTIPKTNCFCYYDTNIRSCECCYVGGCQDMVGNCVKCI